ncbi:phenylphosphate carboxylase subunit delta, partial [Glaciimonas sp. Cout2]|nr:phenylphosphate carboxylase subunit delta [Glaciimonas sp. Cout2]
MTATITTTTAKSLKVNRVAKAAQVQLMIFDVDGILTDGSLHFGPEGEMMKSFNVLDGQGIRLLQQAGI